MPRKSSKVDAIEARFGKPIALVLAEVYNAQGSSEDAAKIIGVSRQTFDFWLWKYGVTIERRAVVGATR